MEDPRLWSKTLDICNLVTLRLALGHAELEAEDDEGEDDAHEEDEEGALHVRDRHDGRGTHSPTCRAAALILWRPMDLHNV